METISRVSDYLESSFREKLLEHVFVAEILQEAWLGRGQTVEVLRAEVDSSGYDLVLECNGVIRYVQLKGSRADAKTSRQTVNVKLADKPGGCIIWLLYQKEADAPRVKLDYLFYGAGPGDRLPALGEKAGRHTKANAKGYKAERPNSRVVTKSRFRPAGDVSQLMDWLFGGDAVQKQRKAAMRAAAAVASRVGRVRVQYGPMMLRSSRLSTRSEGGRKSTAG